MFLLKLLAHIVEQLIRAFEKLIDALPLRQLSQSALERIVWIVVIGFLFILFWLIQSLTWTWLIQFLLRRNV